MVGGGAWGDAWGVGFGVVEDSGACGDEEGVDVAVVAAFEFEDFVAAGVSAGEADGGHGCFGAGVDEANFFGGGAAHDFFCEKDFCFGGGAVGEAAGGGLLDGFDDGGVCVAHEHGAPGAEEVDVCVAVDVVEFGSLCGGDEACLSADGVECSYG